MQVTQLFPEKFGFTKRIATYNFFILIVFRFKTKLIKKRSSQNRTTERVKVATCGINWGINQTCGMY